MGSGEGGEGKEAREEAEEEQPSWCGFEGGESPEDVTISETYN